jgi:hypothetical protein
VQVNQCRVSKTRAGLSPQARIGRSRPRAWGAVPSLSPVGGIRLPSLPPGKRRRSWPPRTSAVPGKPARDHPLRGLRGEPDRSAQKPQTDTWPPTQSQTPAHHPVPRSPWRAIRDAQQVHTRGPACHVGVCPHRHGGSPLPPLAERLPRFEFLFQMPGHARTRAGWGCPFVRCACRPGVPFRVTSRLWPAGNETWSRPRQ